MAEKNIKRGMFITFEGPEGCGKSTHAQLLCDFLKARSYDCVLTREPGGTKAGEEMRRILLHSNIQISDLTELFLFEAARAEIVAEVIKPSLAEGKVVARSSSDAQLAELPTTSGAVFAIQPNP